MCAVEKNPKLLMSKGSSHKVILLKETKDWKITQNTP